MRHLAVAVVVALAYKKRISKNKKKPMATLKQMQARKNLFSVLLAVVTMAVSFFAYTREDIYLFGILGSLLYAAPAVFFVLFLAIRLRGEKSIIQTIKFLIIVLMPLVFYVRLSTSIPNENISKQGLRIASYNVNYFNTVDLDAQLDILEKVDADILSLIEVNKEWRHRLKDYSETYPFVHIVEGSGSNDVVGLNMLLSKFPIKQSISHDFGHIGEHRIKLPSKVISIVQVHPTPPLGKYLTQRRNISLDIASKLELGEYKVFLGDFNAVHWQDPIKKIVIEQGLRVATKGDATWPVPLPAAPIDHILTSFNLAPKGNGKVCVITSDHCLIYVDIVIDDPSDSDEEDGEPLAPKLQEETISPYSVSR
ncbi:MAG: endonuclease/exonuclease/phosphatase family metal-dependent hydrolase [Alphaproteobacteria bacterium]|jgi:endonuclease/exonuclease/phosphatase family metal-dependent hydrolase